MRLIGGAILMSVQDEETGERKWKTGLTPEGISASLLTAGTINTGNISIMNGKDATFMWNAYGLSAFDVDWSNGSISGAPNKRKFVRFDKYGIYGINGSGTNSVDGTTWKPSSYDEIDTNATFALTWEGLKVTGNDGAVARIGKLNNSIMEVIKPGESKPVFSIDTDGNVKIKAEIEAVGGTIGGVNFASQTSVPYRNLIYNSNFAKGFDGWTIFDGSKVRVKKLSDLEIDKPEEMNIINDYCGVIVNTTDQNWPGFAAYKLP
jgi:hypothetical protein